MMTTVRLQFARSPQQVRIQSAAEQATESEQQEQQPGFTEEQIQQMFSGLAMAISELENKQRQSINELQQVAIELAVTAASGLTGAIIECGQFRIDQLVAESLAQLQTTGPVTLHLHPQDLELFHELNNKHTETATDLSQVQLAGDPELKRGSCTATSGGVSLVSDLESRLASVRQVWMENLDDAQTERRTTGDAGWQPGRVPDRRETA